MTPRLAGTLLLLPCLSACLFPSLEGLSGKSGRECPENAAFCDDFESGVLDKWPIQSPENGGTLQIVDDAAPPQGARALRAHTTAPSGLLDTAVYVEGHFGTLTTAAIAAKAYLRLPQTALKGSRVLALRERTTAGLGDSIAVRAGPQGVWAVAVSTASSSPAYASLTPVRVDQWQCVVLVLRAGAPPSVALFVDDELIIESTPLPADAAYEAFNRIAVGAVRMEPAAESDFFVDLVAVVGSDEQDPTSPPLRCN